MTPLVKLRVFCSDAVNSILVIFVILSNFYACRLFLVFTKRQPSLVFFCMSKLRLRKQSQLFFFIMNGETFSKLSLYILFITIYLGSPSDEFLVLEYLLMSGGSCMLLLLDCARYFY